MYIVHAIEFDFKFPHHIIYGCTTDKLKAYQEAARRQYKYIFEDPHDFLDDEQKQTLVQIEKEYQNVVWDDFESVYTFFKLITRKTSIHQKTLWDKIYKISYDSTFDLVFVSEITEMDDLNNYACTYVGAYV